MLVENSGGAVVVNHGNDGGVGGGGSDSDSAGGDDGDRNSAGKRWSREETLVLLQVRQSMDEAFRDSNLKAPLWDEVSRLSANYGILSQPEPSSLGIKDQKVPLRVYDQAMLDNQKSTKESLDMSADNPSANISAEYEGQDSSSIISGLCPEMCPGWL